MSDALKLLFAKQLAGGADECILLFGDEAAAKPFREGKSWMAECLRQLNIKIEVIELPPGLRDKVLKAQKRQAQAPVASN